MSFAPNSIAARDIAYHIHPYTNLALHERNGPFVVNRGEGVYVFDDDNNRYIEGMSGLWCTGLGFSEQRLVDAATAQLKKLPYSHNFAHRAGEPIVDLAEKLIQIAPPSVSKAYFVTTGSEAVENAIKFTWYYNNGLGRPEKKKFIARRRGYHGITIAAGSLTNIPLMQNDFDVPLDRMKQTDTPCLYRYGNFEETEEAFATQLADSLNALIEEEGPETVAAFIAEPVMGAGGVMVPPATYFEKIQAVLKRHDVLMIADEVICGFGRTGNMWGSETFNIQPDMLTCAKQLSSAYLPIAALLVSDQIYQVLVEQSKKHGALGTGHTYGGHPVSAAVAVETLKIYEERDIIGHVQSVAPRFLTRLHALGEHPLVGDARGVGLIGGLEIVADKGTREQFPAAERAAAQIAECIKDEGVISRALPGDVLALCPPLIITELQIDALFDGFQRGLDTALKLVHG